MVRYLNSQTREEAVLVAGVYGELNGIADRWELKKNPPKEVIGYIRASARFAARAMRELDKELDDNEVQRIYRMAETTKFKLSYTEHSLSSKAPGVYTYDITEDERDNLVEALTEVKCKGCKGHVKDCTVRTNLFKWDVKPIHEVTDEIYPCQYMPPEEE